MVPSWRAQTRRARPSVSGAVELQVLERSGSAIASTCRRPSTSSHRSQLDKKTLIVLRVAFASLHLFVVCGPSI